MKERLLKQAKREYSLRKRLMALMVEGIFFIGILPAALVYLSSYLDARFGLSPLNFGAIGVIMAIFFILFGFLFACWAIYVQITIGRGTPAPVMATQKLIIQKPYNYCRNPMALGTIVIYLGVAMLVDSISGVVLVLIGAILLLTYIKYLEEKEMELRFGEDYQKYRQETPFIIPRLRKR